MLAATRRRYGGPEVISLVTVPDPLPGPGEILIDVAATAVTTADWRIRAAAFPGIMALPGRLMFGLGAPRQHLLGSAFAGRVAAVGEGMMRFSPGDEVFGAVGHGAHAERLTASAGGPIVHRPAGLSPAAAAALPFGGLAALNFLRDTARIAAGERVLILGASGAVGSNAVQIAVAMGARVTAAAGPRNQSLLRELGAHATIDYTRADPLAAGPFDVILDPAGTVPVRRALKALAAGGRFVPLEFGLPEIAAALLNPIRRRKVRLAISGETRADLELLADMTRDGTLKPVIDSVLPFAQIAKAHARVQGRHARGTVVLGMAEADRAAA